MSASELFIPMKHELQQIEAGTLRGFVRPVEPQPTKTQFGGWLLHCGKDHNYAFDNLNKLVNWLMKFHPWRHSHQVLAVAEEWVRGGYSGLPYKSEPAKTMPPERARYHVEITDVRPVQVTEHTIRDLEILGFKAQIDSKQNRHWQAAYQEFAKYWNTTYSELSFAKKPWAWLFTCKLC